MEQRHESDDSARDATFEGVSESSARRFICLCIFRQMARLE
jgi:hypothetical protein